MSLIIVGEAATKVMDRYADFAVRHPEVPWRSMRGMRNRIAHGYFDINLDFLWDTVRTALPVLLDGLGRDGRRWARRCRDERRDSVLKCAKRCAKYPVPTAPQPAWNGGLRRPMPGEAHG